MAETLSTRALQMLVARITEEQERHVIGLAAGAATSLEDYKHRVGILRGLEDAKTLCAEVERDLYGNDKKRDH